MGTHTRCTGCLNYAGTALCFPWGLSKGLGGVLERDSLFLNYFMPCSVGMKTYWQISVVIFFQGLRLKKISPRNTSGSHRLEVWVHPSTFRFIWLKVTRNTLPHHHLFFFPLEFLSDRGERKARRRISVSSHRCHHCPVSGAVAGENSLLVNCFLNGREDSALLTLFHLQMKPGLSSMPRQMSEILQVLPLTAVLC